MILLLDIHKNKTKVCWPHSAFQSAQPIRSDIAPFFGFAHPPPLPQSYTVLVPELQAR